LRRSCSLRRTAARAAIYLCVATSQRGRALRDRHGSRDLSSARGRLRLTQTIELNVNGARSVVSADPGTPLIYVLRNDLKLKGARFGYGAGVCGCCTVLLDGRGIQSCNTPISAAQDREVTTIEGLGGKLRRFRCSRPLSMSRRASAATALPASSWEPRHCSAAIRRRWRRRSVPSWTSICAGAAPTIASCARYDAQAR
jgi:hypothetical protein